VARARSTHGPSSVLARSAALHTAVVAAGVLGVAVVAGAVRILPLFLADRVPSTLLPVLGRGILGVALETAVFVAPPVGWALAASRLVERGEARALFAIGVRPSRLVADSWPAGLGVALAAGLAAVSWGGQAAAPGASVRGMLAAARAACVAGPRPGIADVPLLGASWVCLEGDEPRILGPAPGGGGVLAASSLSVSDDLRVLEATDLEIVVRAAESDLPEPPPKVTLHAASAVLRGVPPVGRASNLRPAARAALLGIGAAVLAAAAAGVALAASVRTRAAAIALGAAGPAAALLVLSALERGETRPIVYLAVPLGGLVAQAVVGALLSLRSA
jgi:hypothetical protein